MVVFEERDRVILGINLSEILHPAPSLNLRRNNVICDTEMLSKITVVHFKGYTEFSSRKTSGKDGTVTEGDG